MRTLLIIPRVASASNTIVNIVPTTMFLTPNGKFVNCDSKYDGHKWSIY